MPVFVMGPQRTGTSLVAGILERLGVDMCVKPTSENAAYSESDDWSAICQKIAGDWRCPQIHHCPDSIGDDVKALVKKKNAEEREEMPWGAKTPFFCLVGHHIIPHVKDLRVIRTTRDIDLTIDSLCRREPQMPRAMGDFIQKQAFCATTLTDGMLSVLKIPTGYIQFDFIFERPVEIIADISKFVFGEVVDLQNAVEFIDPSLRHFKPPYEELQKTRVTVPTDIADKITSIGAA